MPSTEVRLQAFIWESPPVIRTATQHFFKTGQNVVITGLKLRDGAPERVGDLVESISGDHASCRDSAPALQEFLPGLSYCKGFARVPPTPFQEECSMCN